MKILNLSPRTARLIVRGQPLDGSIRPSDYKHPLLASELADEYLEMFQTMNLSHGTIYNHRKAVISLLKSLPASLKKSSSLGAEDDSVIEAFYQWEVGLGEKYSPNSEIPSVFPTVIRRIVRQRLTAGKLTSRQAEQWALGSNLHQRGIVQPLDEFSNAERLAIRDGSRQRVRDLEKRMKQGRELLALGKDPRAHGWSNVPNMLWATHNLTLSGMPSILKEISMSFDSLTESEQYLLGGPHPFGRGRSVRIIRNLMSLIYPTALDLSAYRTLLQLESGAAPEEITNINTKELQWHGGAIHVSLHKNRAHRTRRIRLKTSGDQRDVREGWRGGDLIHGLLGTQQLTKERPGGSTTALFHSASRQGGTIIRRQEYFLDVKFSSLVATLPTTISRPHDPRRLRKTVKSAQAAVLQSAIAGAGDDHTVAVFQRHYAQSSTVHILAANAVTTAQQQVFSRATAGPTFIPLRATEALSTELSKDLHAAASNTVNETAQDAVMTVAECSDPYSSPFRTDNELCQVRPNMCFACPNAIIFTDHLPRLIAYRAILEAHQRELPPTVFAAGHGQQLKNLERILEEFSPEQISHANAGNELTETATIHVPITQRGTHF